MYYSYVRKHRVLKMTDHSILTSAEIARGITIWVRIRGYDLYEELPKSNEPKLMSYLHL
jgi:hypothetical protein